MYDTTGTRKSIDWSNRYLVDSETSASVDWDNNLLNDSLNPNILSLAWTNRTLHNTLGNITLNWSTLTAFSSNGDQSIRWNSRQLVSGSGTTTTVNWNSKVLGGHNGTALNWNTRLLTDPFSKKALSWTSRSLYDASEIITIDWNNRILSGSHWKYASNYSSSYTARSVVDKDYVDNKTTGSIYTPGLPSSSNLDSSQSYQCFWKKSGNFVDVDGTVRVNPNTVGVQTFFIMDLPIPTTITTLFDLTGQAVSAADPENHSAGIYGFSNKARFDFYAKHTNNIDFNFHFTYRIA
jgi:hypothetical protein